MLKQGIGKKKAPLEPISSSINGPLVYHLVHAHFFLNLALDGWNANPQINVGVLSYSSNH